VFRQEGRQSEKQSYWLPRHIGMALVLGDSISNPKSKSNFINTFSLAE